MAKFYIQSGNVSFVVIAQDAEGAALWAMHQTIEKMVALYEEEAYELKIAQELFGDELTEEPVDVADDIYEPMLDGLAQFAETIQCSERGFGRDDAGCLETEQVFLHWRQLMQAADYLFDELK